MNLLIENGRMLTPQGWSQPGYLSLAGEKIAAMGTISKKDFGKVMGALMKEFKGQADGNLVKEILTRKLENL